MSAAPAAVPPSPLPISDRPAIRIAEAALDALDALAAVVFLGAAFGFGAAFGLDLGLGAAFGFTSPLAVRLYFLFFGTGRSPGPGLRDATVDLGFGGAFGLTFGLGAAFLAAVLAFEAWLRRCAAIFLRLLLLEAI